MDTAKVAESAPVNDLALYVGDIVLGQQFRLNRVFFPFIGCL